MSTKADDSIPGNIKEIIESIKEEDPGRFSKMVYYPLRRPYPLRDIRDEESMQNYYTTLIDDSIKQLIAGDKPLSWEEYGWRGWSAGDGRYIWVDSLIYEIPYVSGKEKAERNRLIKEEMATLSPGMQGNWTPLVCLRSNTDQRVFRIDEKDFSEEKPYSDRRFRMAVYNDIKHLDREPAQLLSGKLELDNGTMASRIFTFTSPNGNVIIYEPDRADSSEPGLRIKQSGKEETELEVAPAYWLDLR